MRQLTDWLKRFWGLLSIKQFFKGFMKLDNQDLRNLFTLYSPQDVARGLFALTTWNDNRGVLVRHKFLYLMFYQIPMEEYSQKIKIETFDEFSNFAKKIIEIAPSFPMLEDCLPEGDWGEIKYWHNGTAFKMLYGDELSGPYDFLYSFEAITNALIDEIVEIQKESPREQLETLLKLVDCVVSSLPENESKRKGRDKAEIGHFEIPSEAFWNEVSTFFNEVFPKLKLEDQFINRFTKEIGSSNYKISHQEFGDMFLRGTLPSMVLVKIGAEVFPANPRFYLSSFIDSWGKTLYKILPDLKKLNELPPIPIKIGLEFGKFLRERVKEDALNVLVSATTIDEKPEDFIFPIALTSRNKIYLFAFTSITRDKAELEKSLINISKNIEQAKKRFKDRVGLVLHLKQQLIIDQSDEPLTPKFVVVIPHITTGVEMLKIPRDLDAEVYYGEKLLGLFDEINGAEEFDKFCEFKTENESTSFLPMIDSLDLFGSFRDLNGLIIDGAIHPDLVMIDPHWGSSYRYKSLSSFWQNYPNTKIFNNPRAMVLDGDFENYIRITKKDFRESYFYCNIGLVEITITTPYFTLQSLEFRIADTLAQCLADYFTYLPLILEKHVFFSNRKHLRLFIFPNSLVLRDKTFYHLSHFLGSGQAYDLDSGKFDVDEFGIRCVFDMDKTIEKFSNFADSSAEIEFFLNFLEQVNLIEPDNDFKKITNKFLELVPQKPGYTVEVGHKEMSFPDNSKANLPDDSHFKRAVKRVAIIAKEVGLVEGTYEQADAKIKINSLLIQVSSSIDKEISTLNFQSTALRAIKEIDSLIFDDVMKKWNAKSASKRRVNYDVNEIAITQDEKIKSMHRNIRFFIEKLVLLNPVGNNEVQEDQFKELIALIDWYFSFAMASDQIHHGIYPAKVSIDDQFKVAIHLPDEIEQAQKDYELYLSKRSLGKVSPGNSLISPRPPEDYLADLNKAFVEDLGFSYSQLLGVLDVLAKWGYLADKGEGHYYFASPKAIAEIYNKSFKESDVVEISRIEAIVDFLILKQENVKKIVGTDSSPDLIPTWEHLKRHSRYTIRPIFKWDTDVVAWGPCSAYKSRTIWMNFLSHGKIPIDLESTKIEATIQAEKKLLEDELEKKCFSLVQQITTFSEPNVQLHRREKNGGYPQDLGDYDVLAYIKDKNIVLNIECKHLLPAFCLKDARRLKENLFGANSDVLDVKSYVGKVQKRHTYLSENLEKVFKTLKWGFPAWPLEVKSLFVTKETYWWTFNPPLKSDIQFLLYEELGDWLEKLP